MGIVNFPAIMLAALVASMSPGPATLAILSTSASAGRTAGLAISSGILTGSLMWSTAAALGVSSLVPSKPWLISTVHYAGAAYMVYLACKSITGIFASQNFNKTTDTDRMSLVSAFLRGLALHLTNPKAILFFITLYSVSISSGVPTASLLLLVIAIGLQSAFVFYSYAVLFSFPVVIRFYSKLHVPLGLVVSGLFLILAWLLVQEG